MQFKIFFRYLNFVLFFLVATLIFYMSSRNAVQSSEISGSLLTSLIKIINPGFDRLTLAEQENLFHTYHVIIRKMAHFLIFTALGMFFSGFLHTYNSLTVYKIFLFSIIFIILYAISDEIHQLFVIGRSGQISDVILDSFGGCFGIVLTILFFRLFPKILGGKDKNEA